MNVKIKYILSCILLVFLSNCINAINSLTDTAQDSGFDLTLLGLAGNGGSQQVDPTRGAVVQAPTMSLTVPVGALDEVTTISYVNDKIREVQDTKVPTQAAYKFSPAGLEFNKPATLEICYDANKLAKDGLDEKSVEIYYLDPKSGQYISVGGDVNLGSHCVSAPIHHFSTYLMIAQSIEAGVGNPNIGGALFYPSTLIENLPATIRTRVTTTGAVPSSIASVIFYYRTPGDVTWIPLPLEQEEVGNANDWYTARIPAADITSAGLEYYIEAHNSYNKSKLRPVTAPLVPDSVSGDIRDAATPIRFQEGGSTIITAGYSRDFHVQVKGNASPSWFRVVANPNSSIFDDGDGVVTQISFDVHRYTAKKCLITCDTNLEAKFGNLTIQRLFKIVPGMLNEIKITHNGVELPEPGPLEVDGNTIKVLDAMGYDKYGNFMLIKPVFSTTGGIGTVDNTVNLGKFTAANVGADTLGTITASIGGFSSNPYSVLVHPNLLPPCVFDSVVLGQGFDNSCAFGP